ncbi:phage tail protein [Neisseria musculi]|uniref:Phage tail family protein n=1 Tax=Neisseria musculi TaxID=1815583 RepID=A0A7H1MAR6_9NEIS|nr:phage tail protein [Neisseria musculi]QNT58731.1 phage tail family protein [Neisseria musculi]
MALTLPNGSTVHIGSALDVEKTATAVTNAAEAVVTSTGHGLATGDYIVFDSGWSKLYGRVFRVTQTTADAFKLDGLNTTSTADYPAGAGGGKFRKVKTWTQLSQILEVSMSGGEQQYYNYGFLEDDFERQLPTVKTAMSFTFGVADDPTLPGYKAAVAAGESKVRTPMLIRLSNGGAIAYNGLFSVNKVPTLTRNEGMKINISYALDGEISRY